MLFFQINRDIEGFLGCNAYLQKNICKCFKSRSSEVELILQQSVYDEQEGWQVFLQKQQGYPASQASVCSFYDIDLKSTLEKYYGWN